MYTRSPLPSPPYRSAACPMQLSAPRAFNPPSFANHTPRPWEITAASNPSQSHPADAMPSVSDLSPPALFIGQPNRPSILIMGQHPSCASRTARNSASNTTILREDSIHQVYEDVPSCYSRPSTHDGFDPATNLTALPRLPPLSREDSWSMHYDCTNQAPYSTCGDDDSRMITQTSLVHMPRAAETYKLSEFLRTTGPVAPHREPTKIEPHPRRAASAPKSALRFLKMGAGGPQPSTNSVEPAHEKLIGVLRDEGGLLDELPGCVEQKLSTTGKRYLALQVPGNSLEAAERDRLGAPPQPSILDPEILESRVSALFSEESITGEVLDNWLAALSKPRASQEDKSLTDPRVPATLDQEFATRLAKQCPTPIRPAASNPPSPLPESASSIANSSRSGMVDTPIAKQSPSVNHTSAGHPSGMEDFELRNFLLLEEDFPMEYYDSLEDVEIKQPLPMRFASHPVLLQRTSSIATSFSQARGHTDSPGPAPPPRSPLRLKNEPRTIEEIISAKRGERKRTPKIEHNIQSSDSDFDFGMKPLRATVTTECSGPIKRPKSRAKEPSNYNEREPRPGAGSSQGQSTVKPPIDSGVQTPAQTARRRLKKLRPQIHIPPLRAPSAASIASASSTKSWMKVTQPCLAPVSPVPSLASNAEKTGYTPISSTASAEVKAVRDGSIQEKTPVMMVAEEIPMTKTKASSKPVKSILKGSKPYSPRPRSATKRRSRSSLHSARSSPGAKSPILVALGSGKEDESPPLPSPPPNKALPPTPPASGSERTSKANSKAKLVVDTQKAYPLSDLPSRDVSPIDDSGEQQQQQQQQTLVGPAPIHLQQPANPAPSSSNRLSTRTAFRIHSRIAALEKQNALLHAALMAVLRTNGDLNAPLPDNRPPPPRAGPMVWESRVARRGAATAHAAKVVAGPSTHTPGSSNGSALEMYMSTRREGSRKESSSIGRGRY